MVAEEVMVVFINGFRNNPEQIEVHGGLRLV